MKKIPTLFKRDFTKQPALVTLEYNDGTEWVQRGEGQATKKYDGTCALVRDGKLYKRYELRVGKTPPAGYEQVDFDETTGKGFGWLPVSDGPEDKYFREAWSNLDDSLKVPGTYELVGPKVQGNPEHYEDHRLVWHEDAQILFPPVTFDELKQWLENKDVEGIVWHHPDGRMVKIKKKDFGLKREA